MRSVHIPEEALIEYAIGASAEREGVREHLAECENCREALQAIRNVRSALRGEGPPEPDVEEHWVRFFNQVRSTPIAHKQQKSQWWKWIAIAVPACAIVMLLAIITIPRRQLPVGSSNTSVVYHRESSADLSGQLAGIERLLTLVRHTDGPLDGPIRSEAVTLLEKNSACIQVADLRGEVGVAQVLENSGYLLSTIAHATGTSNDATSRNMELNLDGTLLQVRILLQNGASTSTGGGSTS